MVDRRRVDYTTARIVSAITLTLAVVVIVLVDAISDTYEASPATLVALLGTVCALLAVEGIKLAKGGE